MEPTLEQLIAEQNRRKQAPSGPSLEQLQAEQARRAQKNRAKSELDKLEAQGVSAVTAPSVRLPFDDNIRAVAGAIPRMISDQVGPLEAYDRELAFSREREKRQHEKHPILQTVGDVAGSVVAGGGAGKAVQTAVQTGAKLAPATAQFLSKTSSALPSAVKTVGRGAGLVATGAGYGAVTGLDIADGENVKETVIDNAKLGALTAPAVALGVKAGGKLINAAARPFKKNPLDVLDSPKLFNDGIQKLNAAKNQGAEITKKGATRLINNLKLAAGKPNKELQKKTFGIMKKFDDDIGKPMSIDRLHKIRREIGKVLKDAKDSYDRASLMKLMDVVDNFIDNPNPNPAFFRGSPEALTSLREGIQTMHRGYKTELLENIFDVADVSATSGMGNALRTQFKSLYKKILNKKVGGFTDEEVVLIRQLASAQTTDQVTKIIARFAPRGPVATGLGMLTGAQTLGPAGVAVAPVLGGVAARGVDQSAIAAAKNLQGVAAGFKPPANFVPIGRRIPTMNPAITGGLLYDPKE